ncbi:uncharacterized protein LOC132739442 [Ruditapes philippinarum]|uniref:uncharacterized protein LOC132739442 n=1 Tax=Ruditapes philippinarum TaxID=129788 RepID=UPI00295B07F3|nr:uncharacterized protein LOC132739442 [Ruditapes philippinarum]
MSARGDCHLNDLKGGSGPTTTDLDITLITCLLRNIKFFGLNKNFQWNSVPANYDFSVEADMSRLKIYRNEVLLRLNSAVTPIPHLQQMIDDFKVNPLDPEAETRVQEAIDSWKKIETGIETDLKIIKKESEKIKYSVKMQDQTVKKYVGKVDELNKKTSENAKQIQELKKMVDTDKHAIAGPESKYEEFKEKVKNELITWYNTNHSTVPLSPLTGDFGTPLAGFYIMPEIVKQTNLPGGRKETTRVESLHDLLTPGRNIPREVYLSAVAGFGKTAFSKYLALTWCQAQKTDENYKHFKEKEIKALSGFDFLFLVLLRDSGKFCDVDEMIDQQVIKSLPCSSSDSLPKDLLKDILRYETCLVILDGLDEWSHPDNKCTRLIKDIPHRYAREKCVILTTTRPWKLGVSNLKASQIDKTVELVKLNEDNERKFKLNAFKILKADLDNDKLLNEVCRFEEKINDHELKDMESTPLLLLYLICLWIEDIPIGNSTAELYASIIQLLLSRTEKIHGKFQLSCKISLSNVPECFIKHRHCYSYYAFLATLGKLAFYKLFNEEKEHTLVFNKNVAEKYLDPGDLDLSLRSGMLTENKVKTLVSESSTISFSHKTVQEYFSAIFISFSNTIEVKKIIFGECNSLQKILNMSKVFVFISNMNPKLMSELSCDFMPVINNDEKTRKYRTMTYNYYRYFDSLQDIQDMYMSCFKENKKNKDLKLCLQDFLIKEKCQQKNYFKQLQHLCYQNKENIKSIMIKNNDICSLQDIISLFTLSDLPNIQKLFYRGKLVEDEIIRLLLNPLRCLCVISSKWENKKFQVERCPMSEEIIGRMVTLQHLECLHIDGFTMAHGAMETLLNFLTSKISLKDVQLCSLYCSDHDTSCKGFNIDLSQHSHLRGLGLHQIPVSKLNMNASLLEKCTIGNLYKPGVVSSFLSQLPAASKLHTFTCNFLESSSDIETMLQTLPLLLHVKHVRLLGINLGDRSLTLSPKMINIEYINMYRIKMSCSVLHDLITDITKLPDTVSVDVRGCDINPETEFENFKAFVKNSDNYVVTFDDTTQYGNYLFQFKTTTNLK